MTFPAAVMGGWSISVLVVVWGLWGLAAVASPCLAPNGRRPALAPLRLTPQMLTRYTQGVIDVDGYTVRRQLLASASVGSRAAE